MERLPEHLHQLVTDNLGIVRKIAWRMSRGLRDPAIDYDDLYSSGCIGLMYAATHYDESEGYAFSSYAYRTIWGYAANSINSNAQVKVPNHIRSLANRIRINDLQDISSNALSEQFGVIVEHIDYAKHFLSIKSVPIVYESDNARINLVDLYVSSYIDPSSVYIDEFIESMPTSGRRSKRRKLLELMLQRGLSAAEAGERLGFTRQAAHVHLKGVREAWQEYNYQVSQ
ncbi:MAG: sigma-70 family RNA polymerase sigma factor [Candidatus Pristimantibacillus sp.]